MDFVILALCFVAGALAHPPPLCPDDPICPHMPGVANFDINRFAGTWYELARSPGIRSNDVRCVTNTYTVFPKNGTMLLEIREYNLITKRGLRKAAMSTIPIDPTEASKFWINPLSKPTFGRAHWVLDTDYDTYALLYTCGRISGTKLIWLMTREPKPAKNDIRRVAKAARNRSFNSSDLDVTSQLGCIYPFVHPRSTSLRN